jgi:hypothetical protein
MELFFFILLLVLLVMFGYAQLQKGVYKIPGQVASSEEEEFNS